MSRTKYIAFIDEVKPTNPFIYYNYTAVIMEHNNSEIFETALNQLKAADLSRIGGKTVNLHYYHLTKKKDDFATLTLSEEKTLWNDLMRLFNTTPFYILAGVVNSQNYDKYCKNYKNNIETLAFGTLLQNIVRFLYMENGYTDIIIESSNDDNKLIEEYYRRKFLGSDLITAEGFKQLINRLSFENKGNLNAGLQLADFMANPVSRRLCGMNQFKTGRLGLDENAYSDLLSSKIYQGYQCAPDELGIKKIF